jgi:twitching motility protein PilU
MERDEGLKFMYQLLTMMMQKKGSDLFITAGFRRRSRSTAR